MDFLTLIRGADEYQLLCVGDFYDMLKPYFKSQDSLL